MKKSLKSRRENLALYLDSQQFESPGYGSEKRAHVRLQFVNVIPTLEIGKYQVRNPTDDLVGIQLPFNDLILEGYCYYKPDGSLNTFGMEVRYADPFRVDLNRAEYMVKLLREVKRGLDRYNKTHEATIESFGEFAWIVADILGIEGLVVRTSQKYTSSYDDMTFDFLGKSDIINVVGNSVKVYLNKVMK